MISYKVTERALTFMADNEGRADLAAAYRAGGYPRAESEVLSATGGNGLEMVAPEDIGALTSAPIFSDDFGRADSGEVAHCGRVFWFPDYMVRDPWEELKNKGRVVFPIGQ